VVEVVDELAQADGAVGWCVSQHAAAQLILAGFPEPTQAEVYADRPDTVIAGATAPKGRALRTVDGWRVSGRWPFVSGCRAASWLYLTCLGPGTDGGPPGLRTALVPAALATIEDTWWAAGLAGTGSHDVVVRAYCPEERCAVVRPDGPLQTEQGSLFLAAVAVGIAARAVDEVVALAGGKVPAFGTQSLAASPLFRHGLGSADMTLAAARALLREQARAVARGPLAPVPRARAYAVAAAVTGLARQVATEAYALGGGTSVYSSCVLQRTLRDLHVAGQHFVNGPALLGRLGEALVAEPAG
jgi:alkylation response protein AidB-like acyl-CoA dehydrogenase